MHLQVASRGQCTEVHATWQRKAMTRNTYVCVKNFSTHVAAWHSCLQCSYVRAHLTCYISIVAKIAIRKSRLKQHSMPAWHLAPALSADTACQTFNHVFQTRLARASLCAQFRTFTEVKNTSSSYVYFSLLWCISIALQKVHQMMRIKISPPDILTL